MFYPLLCGVNYYETTLDEQKVVYNNSKTH